MKRIQCLADSCLSTEEKLAGVLHKVEIKDDRASVLCFYCQEVIALGASKQGITNFRMHTYSDKHKSKQQGLPTEEITAKNVKEQLEHGMYMIKGDSLFCRPCSFKFAPLRSMRKLQNNVNVHEKTQNHLIKKRSFQGVPMLSSFFTKSGEKEGQKTVAHAQ